MNAIKLRKKTTIPGGLLFLVMLLFFGSLENTCAKTFQKKDKVNYTSLMLKKLFQNDARIKVTLHLQGVKLSQALLKLAEEGNVGISFDRVLVPDKQITYHCVNKALYDVLQDLLRNTNLNFTISSDRETIIIVNKKTLETGSIAGTVTDAETGRPMPGASVFIEGTTKGDATNAAGKFYIPRVEVGTHTLVATFIGYERHEKQILVTEDGVIVINFKLKSTVSSLNELTVVSTGYQQIPKERSTGSFGTVTIEQLENKPTLGLLSRLEGQASGLVFHQNSIDKDPKLIIRGRSTIYGDDQPLIVVDGFPIKGDLKSINPNDVQNVTILKDAAAASIWGVKAANGVIVITTKKGSFNQKPTVEFRSQITMSRAPDLSYLPYMSTSDYVDLEISWFEQGRFDSWKSLPPENRRPLSQVIQILMDKRNGVISSAEAEAYLQELRSIDVREEYEDVFFQNRIHTQQMLNIRGGSETVRYFFSAGYDKNRSSEKGNTFDRITLRSDNTFKLLPELNLHISLNNSWTDLQQNAMGLYGFQGETGPTLSSASVNQYTFYPYQQLRDEQGNALPVPRGYTSKYINYLENEFGFQDWTYRPADEIYYGDNTTRRQNTRLAASLEYELPAGFRVDIRYQFERRFSKNRDYQPVETYSTRDLINSFTLILPDSSGVNNQVPVGDILILREGELIAHTFRSQLNFLEEFGGKHEVAAIGGMEIREIADERRTNSYYGYDDRTLQYTDINKSASYQQFGRPFPLPFTFGGGVRDDFSYIRNRYASFYSNVSYTYDNRYIVSASGRLDKSSLFGIRPEDRNVPLWSAGAAWNITNESFFTSDLFSYLKLRATYGFNGNVSASQTAYPIAGPSIDPMTQLPSAIITSPANPLLQWEKVRQINVGLDFSLFDNRLSGSVEWFSKTGEDLFGDHFLDPSSGFSTIRANVASMRGRGFDIELNFHTGRNLLWDTKLLFSHATDKVTEIALAEGNNFFGGGTQSYMRADREVLPLLNRPVYAIYSYSWAGLDEEGNPQLYNKNGEIGNYVSILNNLPPDQLIYHGPARPTFYGGWTNSLYWKGFSLSATITYKFGYFFRRSSIFYYGLSSTSIFRSPGHKDYALRWREPGDEEFTNVPSYPGYSYFQVERDAAYRYSNILVEPADHIRLNDITLSWDLSQQWLENLPVNSLKVYLYAKNIGILWQANDHGIDPDYVPQAYSNYLPPPLTITAGINIEF